MQTFIWSKSRFFLFFAFRFSLFAFHFSLFDNRSASRFYCLVSQYMSEWVCAWASEWVKKWVSVLRQSNSSCHMPSFISSKSRLFLFFAFRFSLFVFRFLLFDHRSVSCCNCYLLTLIRECLSEWVRKWVSECFTSIKQLMPYADVHLVKVKILFVFRFSLSVFRFSLFDNRSASCFYCLVSEYMRETLTHSLSYTLTHSDTHVFMYADNSNNMT